MNVIEQITELQNKVQRMQRERDKAIGALEQGMKKLKQDFQCDTIKQAMNKQKELSMTVNSIEQIVIARTAKLKKEFDEWERSNATRNIVRQRRRDETD